MPSTFEVAGKVIAITGGSGGIGYATAALLLSQGAKISVADLSQTNLDKATSKFNDIKSNSSGDFMTTVVDVRKPDQVDAWIKATVEKFGKLDGAVNLAGVIPKNINIDRVEDMPDEDWQFVIDVNLNGVMHSMRAQIREMNDKGSIVNASSVAGIAGFAKNAAYTAAKVEYTVLLASDYTDSRLAWRDWPFEVRSERSWRSRNKGQLHLSVSVIQVFPKQAAYT